MISNVAPPFTNISIRNRPGLVGIVPSNVRHSVKALTDGRGIIVDYPLRTMVGDPRRQSTQYNEVLD